LGNTSLSRRFTGLIKGDGGFNGIPTLGGQSYLYRSMVLLIELLRFSRKAILERKFLG